MTTLQSAAHPYTTSLHVQRQHHPLPPVVAPMPPGGMSYRACCTYPLTSQLPQEQQEQVEQKKYGSAALPLQTDPEMYALRSMFNPNPAPEHHHSSKHQQQQSNHYHRHHHHPHAHPHYHHHHHHAPHPQTVSQHYHHHHHHHNHSQAPPVAPQVAIVAKRTSHGNGGNHLNDRLAYVEALVDTNAHVIETIWCRSSTQYSKSAVVPLRTFIQEVLKRSRTTYSTLQTALFYLFRARPAIVAQLYPNLDDTQNWQDAYISCGRRMFLASLVVASKFVQDKTYRNSAWAKIAGLPVAEINAAERIFLEQIDYRLYIAQSTFEQWHHLLHMHVEARSNNRPNAYLQDLASFPTAATASSSNNTSSSASSACSSPIAAASSSSSCSSSSFSCASSSFISSSSPPSASASISPRMTHQRQVAHHAVFKAHTSMPLSPASPPAMDSLLRKNAHSSYRKRRFREVSLSDDPLSPSSTGSGHGVGLYSPTHAIPPPVLSLSLPSSISSSPMHTPTQISPVRVNHSGLAFSSSSFASPFEDETRYDKKRRVLEDYTSHHGFALSHVRGPIGRKP
ncbi:hypothetical protein BCR43DRAFT_506513 [Syncephalastrum racemosum]|uniref:Cyclin-domain-containing protein n=1 Tax=Syncephalastrum racemosum TaxID=13706 RepID=A0A1X2H7J9_SYNRA|nr:hypothetical protein BCR43DRAFT_506513 [Syncephalastrum racemosum]